MKNRKIEFQTYSKDSQFNCVAFGIAAPVSKCCKSRVCFNMSALMGGRVNCMDALCANPIMDTFRIQDDIYNRLFNHEDSQQF